MDRLEAMRLLLHVADLGGFSAASRELGVPLPTVSRKVNELEAHLGARLLVRSTRRTALTEAGQSYVAAARRILEAVDAAERNAAGEFDMPRGELVVTAPVLFGRLHMLPVVTDFLAAYPEVDVRLVLSDRNLRLFDDQVDVAARIGDPPVSGLVATRIGEMRTVVCASPETLARHGTPAAPQDLAALPCVNFGFLFPAATWTFRAPEPGGRPIDVPIMPRLTVSTAEAAVVAAERGVGFARVLRYQCVDALAAGTVQLVLEDCECDPLPVNLLHAARRTLPSKTRAFLEFATTGLRETLRPT